MKDNAFFLIDTNILVYAYEKEESHKKKIAQKILGKIFDGKDIAAISNQIISEFIFISTNKGKINIGCAKEIAEDILNFDGFIKIDYLSKTAVSAAEISSKFNMSFWDSLISATMIENNIFKIYTENTKDFKVPGIIATNPFA